MYRSSGYLQYDMCSRTCFFLLYFFPLLDIIMLVVFYIYHIPLSFSLSLFFKDISFKLLCDYQFFSPPFLIRTHFTLLLRILFVCSCISEGNPTLVQVSHERKKFFAGVVVPLCYRNPQADTIL